MASLVDSMDFIQSMEDVLKRSHYLFRKFFNFQSILPQLLAHNLLTSDEWEVISKKDSREQQVDEFLKCLPHKGRNSLNQLIECLELSLDHAGHQDILAELKKHAGPDTSVMPVDSRSSSHNSDTESNDHVYVSNNF